MTRRNFLGSTALAAVGIAGFTEIAVAAATQSTKRAQANGVSIPTLDTQMKFNPDGTCRRFRGNTVICHLQPQGSVRNAVDNVRLDLAKAAFASKVALLPTISYHMTVFPGANDQGREITGWPADLPINATIDECDRTIAERMRTFHLECDLPLRMKVDTVKTVTNLRATTLRMTGANAIEEAKIRKVRDSLVDVFGFRDRNHDRYGFHITLAYQLAPFTPKEQEEHQAILRKHVPLIGAAAPWFEFGNPEFCTFPDMYRFDIQVLLAT